MRQATVVQGSYSEGENLWSASNGGHGDQDKHSDAV